MKITQDVFIHVGALASIPYYWWIIGAVVIVALIVLGVALFRKKKGRQKAASGGIVATKTSVLSLILAFVVAFSMTGISQAFADDSTGNAESYDPIHIYLSEDNELQGYSGNATTDVLKAFSDYPDTPVHAVVTGLDDTNINVSIATNDDTYELCSACTAIANNKYPSEADDPSNGDGDAAPTDSGSGSSGSGGGQDINVSADTDDSTDPGTYQGQIEYHTDDGTENDVSGFVTEGRDYANWMGGLSDSMPVVKMTIPGAHDSACWKDHLNERDNWITGDNKKPKPPTPSEDEEIFGTENMVSYPIPSSDENDAPDEQDDPDAASDDEPDPENLLKEFAVTQYDGLEAQFNAGARFFDLRTFWHTTEKEIRSAHGSNDDHCASPSYFVAKTKFIDMMHELVTLVENHPTEFIMIRVTAERNIQGHTEGSKGQRYYDAVMAEMKSDTWKNVLYDSTNVTTDTTLGTLRGKILICPTHMDKKGVLGVDDPFKAFGIQMTHTDDGNRGFFLHRYAPYTTAMMQDAFGSINGDPTAPVIEKGFYFTEINIPANSKWTPMHYAPGQTSSAISVLNAKVLNHDRATPICFGLVSMDFMSQDNEKQNVYGLSLVKGLIELNYYGSY